MSKIRVLIVDDAVVVRRLLREALSSDPDLEVVDAVSNGRIALARLPQLKPDLVILDIEMPEMNGLEALAEIRKTQRRLPVIMFSTLTERGAATTLDALALGANDYVTKPANVGSVAVALQRVREELIPKIKGLCGKVSFTPKLIRRPSTSARPAISTGAKKPDAVVIGVSTGGPNALATVLPQIPADFPVPIFIVQHMPPIFTQHLANRLNNQSALDVAEGQAQQSVNSGQVWLAPGGHHMVVRGQPGKVYLGVNDDSPENSCRPAADVLFRSAVEVYRGHVLAVVMTGMGHDGLRGCELVREAGGQILVQDESSSVVWGMPGFVVRAGLADKISPLNSIAQDIVSFVQRDGQRSRRLVSAAS